jgi:hypothetical protein
MEIFSVNHAECGSRIGCYEILRGCRDFARIVLELESTELAAPFFDEVYLLLIICSPKIAVDKTAVVVIKFHPLANTEILPYTSGIASQRKWIEVAYQFYDNS